ncbi:MAG TPA: hypothetical protein VFX49_00840 [Chloroflexota bacterium]|nr:hypothetical protein [Chloroflexota bacterium]
MRPLARPGRRQVNRALLAEGAVAALLLGGGGWAGLRGWRWYDQTLRPLARAVPTVTPTPFVDPAVAREEGRRLRQVLDHIGAGIALRPVDQRAATDEFMKALALDPGNFEARQNLIEMGVQPPPGPAITPTVPRPTPLPTVTPRAQR